eukprot:7345753-Ditylum_brightwellii.AAC.1
MSGDKDEVDIKTIDDSMNTFTVGSNSLMPFFKEGTSKGIDKAFSIMYKILLTDIARSCDEFNDSEARSIPIDVKMLTDHFPDTE